MTWLARIFGWLLSLALGWAIAGILLLSGATIMARYIVAQIATLPEKPNYANEDLAPDTAIAQVLPDSRTLPVRSAPQPNSSPAPQNQAPQNQAPQNQTPLTQPTAQLASATTSAPQPVLPEGAYQARVTYPRGLVVRSAPSRRGDRVTGIYKQQTVVILGDSEDGQWQRVRLATGQEGWVIGGYTVPLDDAIDGTAIAR